MKSIYIRNFIATAAVIAACLIIAAVAIIGIGANYVEKSYTDSLNNSAEEVARAASAFAESDSLSSWNLSMMLSAISKATDNRVFITDVDDTIINCSDAQPICKHVGNKSAEYCGSDMLTGSAIISDGSGIPAGLVVISYERSALLAKWVSFIWIVVAVIAAILVALLGFCYWYSKHMTRPLDEMARASRSYAKGDFSARVTQNNDASDEMGYLIDSFNRMADSLEKAEKRRTEFISNVSHELRTPMTTISGFADGILDGTIPKEMEDRYLLAISDETKRLARLTRNMLDVSKMQAMSSDVRRRSDFDVCELILETLLSFESRATAKKLNVDPILPEKSIYVHADKDAITQVVYNLLDNAVKFAREGGKLQISVYTEGKKAVVSVLDEGETIPPEDLPYIFDRFHKSDESRSLDKDGVGLGLYLVKTIINGHDEDIAVNSADGETEFVFTLPIAEKRSR